MTTEEITKSDDDEVTFAVTLTCSLEGSQSFQTSEIEALSPTDNALDDLGKRLEAHLTSQDFDVVNVSNDDGAWLGDDEDGNPCDFSIYYLVEITQLFSGEEVIESGPGEYDLGKEAKNDFAESIEEACKRSSPTWDGALFFVSEVDVTSIEKSLSDEEIKALEAARSARQADGVSPVQNAEELWAAWDAERKAVAATENTGAVQDCP